MLSGYIYIFPAIVCGGNSRKYLKRALSLSSKDPLNALCTRIQRYPHARIIRRRSFTNPRMTHPEQNKSSSPREDTNSHGLCENYTDISSMEPKQNIVITRQPHTHATRNNHSRELMASPRENQKVAAAASAAAATAAATATAAAASDLKAPPPPGTLLLRPRGRNRLKLSTSPRYRSPCSLAHNDPGRLRHPRLNAPTP